MARTRIKICGIRDEDALFAAADSGADAVGFMFVASSPRYIDPDAASELMGLLPPFVAAVGVIADPRPDAFAELEQACPTHLTQLHGNENEKVVRACGPDVIKAIRFDPATIGADLDRWAACDDVGTILVDGSAGGQGEAFDWNLLAPLVEACPKPIIIAGGLTPQNVGEAIRAARPYAVDVSSGVESSRGVKDPVLIEAFCEAVQRADAAG
ncbi:MAG: phosphoribosylanthranilate isomerase [Planctomycetota bacterium]|nr:phosphoribosylanthranilate isomerase [Planctomycetota bacterium]